MINLNTVSPLTFKEFKNYYTEYNNINDLQDLYSNYLIDYKANKEVTNVKDNNYISDNYKELIKNIDNSDLNKEIQSYLLQLNYKNPYELDIATHYVSDNLKKEFSRLKKYREELKFSKTKNTLKASKKGIEIYLKNLISRLLTQDSFIRKNTNITSINIKEIINKISIQFVRYCTNEVNSTDSSVSLDDSIKDVLSEKVKRESKKIIQGININHKGKRYILTSNIGKRVSINKIYTDYKKLPSRFFANEIKSLENLNVNLKSKLLEKYLSCDVFYLSGDTKQYELKRVLTAENSNAYSNRYNPVAVNEYGNLIRSLTIPFQLSFENAGIAQALSKNLTFNVDVSAVNDSFYLPNPNKIQNGIGLKNKKSKKNIPINFSCDNRWIKNNDLNHIKVYDNDSLKSYGYQSKENALKYTQTGINRVFDEVSFWSGSMQDVWKNEDAYKRQALNVWPESERFEDLLIKNETAVVLKNDIYGNEFVLYKSVSPKRFAGSSYNLYNDDTSTFAADITSCELYDGLYFNSVLSAITAGDTHSNYTSLTGMYDTVLTNDVSTCAGQNGFFAPLSTVACSAISGDSLVDAYYFEGHPCHGSHFAQIYNKKYELMTFNSLAVPAGFTTTYEPTSFQNPAVSTISLYKQKFETPGAMFVREISSQKVYTLYEKLSGVIRKQNSSLKEAISTNQITNFDIVGNTIYFQTSSDTFTESYSYDGSTFEVALPSNSLI